jgi:hypothetical protein
MSGPDAVVLVEGESDVAAVQTLAAERGRDLREEGVVVVAMGGATNIGHFLTQYGPGGRDLTLTGLCDQPEEGVFASALERAGVGVARSRAALEQLGFYVCVEDLEDELIRALGFNRVQRVIEEAGEMRSFRAFQNQPAQRERDLGRQLRRFMGTKSGRKVRYGGLLAGALPADRVPHPLNALLSRL